MRFLDKHTARDKELLRLEREHDQLRRALSLAPVVPLVEPYQRGWTKTYVLRDDIRRRIDVAVFRTVLAAVNQRIWSREPDFILPDGQTYRLRPRIILPLEWKRLPWPASHRRLFTYGPWEEELLPRRSYRRRRLVVGFSIRNPWWLEEDVQPWMITHQRVELPEVRRRIAEIDARFTHTRGRERLGNLHGRKDWWHRRRPAGLTLREETALSNPSPI
jgi:hypothetical protein